MSPIDFDYLGYFFLRYDEFKKRKETCLSLGEAYLSESKTKQTRGSDLIDTQLTQYSFEEFKFMTDCHELFVVICTRFFQQLDMLENNYFWKKTKSRYLFVIFRSEHKASKAGTTVLMSELEPNCF